MLKSRCMSEHAGRTSKSKEEKPDANRSATVLQRDQANVPKLNDLVDNDSPKATSKRVNDLIDSLGALTNGFLSLFDF